MKERIAAEVAFGTNPIALMRRAVVAIGVAGMVASVLRASGNGTTPVSRGGWTEIDASEFAPKVTE
jgi:hypothetical protein